MSLLQIRSCRRKVIELLVFIVFSTPRFVPFQVYEYAYSHSAFGKIEGDTAYLSNGIVTITYDCSNRNLGGLSVSYMGKAITENSKFNVLYRQGITDVVEFKLHAKASFLNLSSFIDELGEGVELDVYLTDGTLDVTHQARLYSEINMYSLKAILRTNRDLEIISNIAVYETSRPSGSTSISPAGGFLSFFEGDHIWYPARTIDFLGESTSSARSPVLLIDASSKFSMAVFSLTSEHNDIVVESYNWGLFRAGYEVPSGASLPAGLHYDACDWVYFAFGDIDAVLNIYISGVRTLNKPIREHTVSNPFVGRGVCDWYNFYGDIDEQRVKRWLDIISQELKPLYNFYILDDGWENATHRITWSLDWRQYDEDKFPNGIRSVVDYAHRRGIKFILWVRPMVHQASEDSISPIVLNNPSLVAWRNGDEAILNATSQEFKKYLESCFNTWKSWGVDGLKVDFIAVDIGSITYNNPHLWFKWSTRTEALNSYLNTLDALASKYNLPILLCGTPNNFPSIRKYPNLLASRVSQDSEFNGKYNRMQVNTVLKRSFLWGSALNFPDPDAFSSKDEITVTTAVLSGGVIYLGDDLETTNKELAFLRFFKPDSSAIPITSDWTREFVLLARANMTISGYRYTIIAIYNWEPTWREFNIALSELGLKTDNLYHVFEAWSGEYLGRAIGTLSARLRPLSVTVLIVTEYDIGPKVFIASPATELTSVSYDLHEMRLEVNAYPRYTSFIVAYSPKVPTRVMIDGVSLNKVQDLSLLKTVGQEGWYYAPLSSTLHIRFAHVNSKSYVKVIFEGVHISSARELKERIEPWLPLLFLSSIIISIVAATLSLYRAS